MSKCLRDLADVKEKLSNILVMVEEYMTGCLTSLSKGGTAIGNMSAKEANVEVFETFDPPPILSTPKWLDTY